MPSQLLSLPSHTSGVGRVQPSHTRPIVPRQTMWPSLQAPPGASICAWVIPGHRQSLPIPGKMPLSMTPSQLLSMPSQISTIGIPVALQTSRPMLQTKVPDWQVPRALPHTSPTPGSIPSSIMPSQSSSRPLQTSVCGVTMGVSQNVPRAGGVAGQDAVAPADADAVVRARRADHEAFVDVAVAVVVQAVAALRRHRAAARLAAGVEREALVDLAVAVVVDAVAALDRAVARAPCPAGCPGRSGCWAWRPCTCSTRPRRSGRCSCRPGRCTPRPEERSRR